jgi:putative SOS response-associated peptidase YedK
MLILGPRYNVTSCQDMPVVYRMGKHQVAEDMSWGFVPFWNKDRERRANHQRPWCLIPATGFYEWACAGGRTQPYYIHLKHEPVFSFAGLYDSFAGKDEKEHKVYTILTTRPNRLLAPIRAIESAQALS